MDNQKQADESGVSPAILNQGPHLKLHPKLQKVDDHFQNSPHGVTVGDDQGATLEREMVPHLVS
jgi:hypothetical protein